MYALWRPDDVDDVALAQRLLDETGPALVAAARARSAAQRAR